MSGKDKASAEDLHVMDTVEQYETYEDYLDSQVRLRTSIYIYVGLISASVQTVVVVVLEFARVVGGCRDFRASASVLMY